MSGQISDASTIEHLTAGLQRPVSDETRRRAALHVLDWIGCATGAKQEPAARIARKRPVDTPDETAFAWGMLGNILEMDDVDKRAILHPGPTIIPAALALAETSSGPALLDAVVRGYEATIRLGRAVGPGHYAYWHNTGTCGPIGAAAANASLIELEPDAAAHALALATSQGAGLWQTRHEPTSMGKQLHTGHAARAGLDAARLAADGFKGPLSILEGEQGFFAAMCPGANAKTVLGDYDPDWLIHDVSFKPWPACRHAHAAIDAALMARAEIGADELIAVEVVTYSDVLKFCDRPEPSTVAEAKFSLQHAVAAALIGGEPKMEDFDLPVIKDEQITALRNKVSVRIGEPFEAAYPARFGAAVIVETSSGSKTFQAPDALGDPENPLSQDGIVQKARTLMLHGGLPAQTAENLISKTLELPTAASAAPLIALIREALR